MLLVHFLLYFLKRPEVFFHFYTGLVQLLELIIFFGLYFELQLIELLELGDL